MIELSTTETHIKTPKVLKQWLFGPEADNVVAKIEQIQTQTQTQTQKK